MPHTPFFFKGENGPNEMNQRKNTARKLEINAERWYNRTIHIQPDAINPECCGIMAAKRKIPVPKTAGKQKRPLRKLLGYLIVFSVLAGAGLYHIAEKYADSLPYYQEMRARAYFLKDRLLKTPDPTVLIRSPEEAAASPYDNLKLGVPAMTDAVIDRRGYAFGYSEEFEQPLWVAYRLTADEAGNRKTGRTDDFRIDPYIATGSARQEDYAKSGFDRGHLVPAADLGWSEKTMSESFYFSNMTPQSPDFNRGIWRKLEEKVRDWAVDYGELYIVTGPVPARSGVTVGGNKVAVPPAFYKVIYAPKAKPPAMIGFVLPNARSSRRLDEFAVPVDAVEALTGLDFFSKLEEPEQGRLESAVNPGRWQWRPDRSPANSPR